MGLAAGIFEFFLTLFDQVVAFLLSTFQRMLRLIPGLLGLGLGVLQLDLQVIQLGQHAVEALIVVRHVIACGVDNFLRDAELGADEEGVRFARHADAQFIGGHQRFDVELAAGVDDAGRFQRVDLQLSVVGRSHEQTALTAQLLENADGQRRALGRVGARAQLVKQGQRGVARQVENAADALHVAGEGGQALLNALLVADVHKVLVKMADDAALVRGDQEAVLGHRVEKARGFERNGLAAGVRAGDDEGVVLAAQLDVHRHDLFLVDERVAGLVQLEVHRVADGGHKGVLLHSQPGLCQQQVDFEHRVIAVGELRLQRADLRRERGQDAGDLLLLLRTQLHDAGVGLDDGGRLYKDRCAGGRDVMDDAADLTAVLGADRHDVAAIAQGNDGILQKFIGGGVADDVIELGADGILGLADFAAQIVEGHTGSVGHLLGRNNALRNLLFQHRLRGQRKKQVVGWQHLMLAQAVPLGQAREIAQGRGNFQQLPHREDAPLAGVGNDAAHLAHAAEAGTAVLDEQRVDGVGLGQVVALILNRGGRLQRLHHFFRFLAGAELYSAVQDLVQLQCCFIGGIHNRV